MDSDRAQLPLFQYIILPDILLTLLIATQLPAAIRFLGFGIFTYLTVTALTFTAGNPTKDYFTGFVLASQFLLAVHLLWLTVPVDDLRHERDKVPARDLPLWQRVYWAFCLNHSVRAVGWTHQVKHVPPRPSESRWLFIRSRLLRIVWNFLIADVSNTYILFTDNAPSEGFVMKTKTIAAWMGVTCGMVNVQYFALAILSVSLGISPPGDWPDVFGKWANAYTLRNFWGKVWHQNLRRLFIPSGRFMTDLLGFKRGTNGSSYTQLYTAFFLSGVLHSTGNVMVGWEWAYKSMPFFLIQAMAVTAEDAVIAISRRLGIKESWWTRLVGYSWVFVWGVHTFSMNRDLGVEAGWGWATDWPFSPVGILLDALQKR